MIYLLINHVPLGKGSSPDKFFVGDLFLQDLRAQARAIKGVGGRLIVATPCVDKLDPQAGGSFNSIEITPDEHGFEYFPLPRYISMREYLSVARELRAKLRKIISVADIVQMDYGGYPIMLGQEAWNIATKLDKKRIWIFDGADPFPRLELNANNEKNPLKRKAKQFATTRKIAFCRKAIQQADLVFAHNAAVVERFKDVWNERCHQFDRSFVTDDVLVSDDYIDKIANRWKHQELPIRLMCAGRQIAIKGTDHVIQAVSKLRKLSLNVELDVMGDGDDLDNFKKLAAGLKVEGAVKFLGTVPYGQPLFDLWARADVMMITNLTAEISRNVLLGLARGMPLITYQNPGTDDLLRKHDCAVIVDRGDVDQLAAAILLLHQQRDRMVKLARNGLKLARSKSLDETHRARAKLASTTLSPCGRGTG
jgi:glycosyltransferase involved in cell wall biosynthesis